MKLVAKNFPADYAYKADLQILPTRFPSEIAKQNLRYFVKFAVKNFSADYTYLQILSIIMGIL